MERRWIWCGALLSTDMAKTQHCHFSLMVSHRMASILMKKHILLLSLFLLLAGCSTAPTSNINTPTTMNEQTLAPHPDNHRGTDADVLWGTTVPDPYRWLEDATSPEVQNWVQAQDSRARAYLSKLPMRDQFAKRLAELLYVPTISTPTARGEKLFYFAKNANQEKSVFYVRDVNDSEDKAVVLIDPNTLSKDGSISLGDVHISPDGKKFAYKLKKNGADQATLYIRDMETQKDLPDVIENARYADPEWLPDGSGFYYTYFPTDAEIPVDMRPGMTDIRFHKLGTPAEEDAVIIEPLKDPTKFHSVELSEDGQWLVYIIQDGWNGTIMSVKRTADKDWKSFEAQKNVSYFPIIHQNKVYLHTNEGAAKFKLVRIDLTDPSATLDRDRWETIIPEEDNAVLEGTRIVRDKIFVTKIRDVVSELSVYDLDGKFLKTLELPEKGSISALKGRPSSDAVYFAFTSYKTPQKIFRVDADTLEMTPWADVKTAANTNDVITEQRFATSKDGTKVPMFILRNKNTPLDGSAKTIVYGYGGFNYAVTPAFNASVYAWIEQGGIYVWSNLRGGSEYGESWHQDGMRLKKQNVFDDYFAVAEYLIENKYTSNKHIAAYGGSNGGLLVGAAMTQRPDLYGAITCAVPLLDMVRYHLFGSGRTWISEYSSVDESEEDFRNILAYSPYAHVKLGTKYPPILFLGADNDDRVDPMHARKMTAAIQDANAGNTPILLRIEKNAGHGGAGLISSFVEKMADTYAFFFEALK